MSKATKLLARIKPIQEALCKINESASFTKDDEQLILSKIHYWLDKASEELGINFGKVNQPTSKVVNGRHGNIFVIVCPLNVRDTGPAAALFHRLNFEFEVNKLDAAEAEKHNVAYSIQGSYTYDHPSNTGNSGGSNGLTVITMFSGPDGTLNKDVRLY